MSLMLSVERGVNTKDPLQVTQVLKTEKYTCAYCGLACIAYQDVVFPENESTSDDIYSAVPSDYSLPIVVDPLCKAVCEIEKMEGKGALIFLPDVKQEDFNNMLRAMFFVYFYPPNKKQKDEVVILFKKLFSLAAPVKEKFGTADPGKIGKILKKLDPDSYEIRGNILRNLVFMPKPSFFSKSYSIDLLKDWFEKAPDVSVWKLEYDILFGKKNDN